MTSDLNREKQFWGDCTNTYFEEQKHYVYAKLMGLSENNTKLILPKSARVLDIGGGPVSLMLKTANVTSGTVVDPIEYPQWTVDRYKSRNIDVVVDKAEYFTGTGYDEVWITNVLKDTSDPERIISNAKKAAPIIRMFEWINVSGTSNHKLTSEDLNLWIGHRGMTVKLSQKNCYGTAYYGEFSGWS